MIRPDWQQKLASAQAATLRRANRRIIMRQVGDRLIPIGISSSRAGADLPEGTGPGGAIILQQGERWGPFAATDEGQGMAGRRSSSRRGGSGMLQMAGQDVEEVSRREGRDSLSVVCSLCDSTAPADDAHGGDAVVAYRARGGTAQAS